MNRESLCWIALLVTMAVCCSSGGSGSMEPASKVWNRAALEAGGGSPGPGDRALASMLLAHGLIMNGGVHHALESLDSAELAAAIEGYAYFGLDEVAAFLRASPKDPVLLEWTDETEVEANGRYWALVPDDDHLTSHFEAVFRQRPDAFAAVDP